MSEAMKEAIIKSITPFLAEINPEFPVCLTGNFPTWLTDFKMEGFNVYDIRKEGMSIYNQASFVSWLKRFKTKQIIIGNSPWIISDLPKQNVLYFKTAEEIANPDFQTFGASVNKITMCLFEFQSTIGGYAQRCLNKFRDRFEAGEDVDTLIDEINEMLGDSIEKVLLVKTMLDSQKKA